METQETYTPDQAATILAVSSQSVRKWLRQGKFPNAFRKSDTKRSNWRIPHADVIDFIARRQPKKES